MDKLKKYYSPKMECSEICRRALNGADYGIWEWNIDTGKIFISENIKKIVENDLLGITTMYEFIDNIAYGKDKALVIRELYEYINGNEPFYQSAFRLKNKNLAWVLIKGKMSKSESECCRLFSGIMSEISENKLSENWDEIIKVSDRAFFLKKIEYSLNMAKLHNSRAAIIYINI
ncbi:signal transduction protein [Clostridium kluyveri]|uniref:Predicted signal transduction protein n=3 Tax=Clostridium kluyveri TaxID=1534 RepID=A5N140_CLOK5|nr:signal transduction protein [Clostridium kluyveri]EDK34836.1 Predicted signal transduction protein [Clostridium kluyveri DSM 555]